MHRFVVGLAVLASALTFAGGASATIRVGVADDFGLHAENSPWFFDSLGELGMSENRVTVNFDTSAPTTIPTQAALDLYMPLATLRGAGVAASSYYDMLAASYDALKAVDPAIRVIGLGLSPRGGDKPNAPNNVSTSPVRFIHGLGKAYRSSRRTRPIMDELAFHPYPDHDRDSLLKGYRWPNAGVPNLGRIKQAFWDAFRGTAQPLFPEGTSSNGLKFRLDELGWQVGVNPAAAGSYFGRETVRPTDEANQSRIYADAVQYLACDPAVGSVLFFLLRDEPNLERWQAGLVRADGTRRPSFDSVKAAVAHTAGRCAGAMRSWRHTTRVEGARVKWPRQRRLPARRLTLALVLNAEEDARFEAGLYKGRKRIAKAGGGGGAYPT